MFCIVQQQYNVITRTELTTTRQYDTIDTSLGRVLDSPDAFTYNLSDEKAYYNDRSYQIRAIKRKRTYS